MKISLLFLAFLSFSNCLFYLQSETMTTLESENGYFFIKASDYTNKNFIFLHFIATNIMLNNLEYCDYSSVPTVDSISDCQFKAIHPYKSKTITNVINDYYKFEKYIRPFSFVIFHYSGVKQSVFDIKVESSSLEKEETEEKTIKDESDKSLIILLVSVAVLIIALIVAIILLVYLAIQNQKIKAGLIKIGEEGTNAAITYSDSLVENNRKV